MKNRLLVCALTSVLLAAPGLAHAQSDPVATKEAQTRFQEGLTLHDQGKDEEARAKFLEAYAVLKAPNVLFNLARSEQLSGHDVDAMTHYLEYVHMQDAHVTEDDRATARQHVAELAKKVGQVSITAPAGARLSVDGAWLPQDAPLPEPVPVAPGKHAIGAKALDGSTKSVDVVASAGAVVTADFTVEGVTSTGGTGGTTTVTGGGRDTGTTEPSTGFWNARNTTVVALGGVAVVGLAVGVVFRVMASGKSDDAATLSSQIPPGDSSCLFATAACQQRNDDNNAAQSDRNLSTAFFIGAGAFAVGAVATYLLWPKSSANAATATAPKSAVAPILSPSLAGVQYVSTF